LEAIFLLRCGHSNRHQQPPAATSSHQQPPAQTRIMEGEEDLADFVAAAMEASDDEDSNALVNSIAQGNRKEGGPPQWQSQYDLMNAHSCAPDRLPACLFDVITLPSQKQNSDGTFSAEEFAGVHCLPSTTKKKAMKACFQLVHDSIS